jgi:hypothetical protein
METGTIVIIRIVTIPIITFGIVVGAATIPIIDFFEPFWSREYALDTVGEYLPIMI